jgi:transcriptional regulator with XRE-family HTH domain
LFKEVLYMARAEQHEELPPFARRLKALREAAGMTQNQLAERSGLHLGAVFKLEQGRREPSWATVQALCDALGVSCEEFKTSAAPAEPTGQVEAKSKPTGSKAKKGRKKT